MLNCFHGPCETAANRRSEPEGIHPRTLLRPRVRVRHYADLSPPAGAPDVGRRRAGADRAARRVVVVELHDLDHEQDHDRLQEARPSQVFEEQVGDLRNGEDEDEVVEEFQCRRPLARLVRSPPSHVSHESNLAVSRTGGALPFPAGRALAVCRRHRESAWRGAIWFSPSTGRPSSFAVGFEDAHLVAPRATLPGGFSARPHHSPTLRLLPAWAWYPVDPVVQPPRRPGGDPSGGGVIAALPQTDLDPTLPAVAQGRQPYRVAR